MANKKADRAQPTGHIGHEEQTTADQQPAAVGREPGEEGPGREYPPEPNPRPWAHNNLAGVQLRFRREPYQAELAFQEKPTQAVIDLVRENGFRWNNQDMTWTRPVGFATQAQDRLVASRTYSKAVDMILEGKGLAPASESEIAF